MNIENKRQLAIILFAVGLGLGASIIMSKVVNDRIEQQTKIIAQEYQGRNAALVKQIDATKKMVDQLSRDHAALVQRVASQPAVRTAAAPTPKPQVPQVAFSLRTPPGKRAVTLSIDSLSAVGGLVTPGDFVDILATLNVPEDVGKVAASDGSNNRIMTVLFQNIQVLAVGTNFNTSTTPPPYDMQQNLKRLNVTFAINPDEAGLLAFAQANGNLQLTLRSPTETQDRVLQEVASWDGLAEFVLERQGTELFVPAKKKDDTTMDDVEEEKPYIQIFRGGREL